MVWAWMRRFTLFRHDRRGVAAIEFALILPFMLILYFGMVEITQGVIIDRQVALTATTVANVVSQYSTISASGQMPDILNASVQIMSPYPAANAKIVISLITIDANGNATIAWSQTLNGTARTAGSSVTLPASLAVPNTSLILSEAAYAYTPLFDFIHIGPLNLTASIYMVPRNSTTINMVS